MSCELQILLVATYVIGFYVVFTFFSKSYESMLEPEEKSSSRTYSISVISAIFWPVLLVISIFFAVYCICCRVNSR